MLISHFDEVIHVTKLITYFAKLLFFLFLNVLETFTNSFKKIKVVLQLILKYFNRTLH